MHHYRIFLPNLGLPTLAVTQRKPERA